MCMTQRRSGSECELVRDGWNRLCLMGKQRNSSDRLDTGDIEHQVDPHSGGKIQTDRHWVNNLSGSVTL